MERRSSGPRRFRPDIEGLRAVAVGLVVAYHAGVPGLSGGYVGVDVFFVVSGFLITGLLVDELGRRGTISLAGFYARRVRRLLPAALLVLVATLVLAELLLPPLSTVRLGADAKAVALYVSNIRFAAAGTDYLGAGDGPSALQHYWSLAVEEQFYLVWPVLLLAVTRVAWLARRLAVVVASLGLASFAFCVWLTERSQPWAFFSLPTRAWELAVGAGLALAVGRLTRLPRAASLPLGWCGLGAMVAAALTFDTTTAFPGWAAALPVLGTAAVIASGTSQPVGGPEVVLGTSPFVAIGRLSYSIYLWHWPLLVIAAIRQGAPLSAAERVGLVALTVVLAAATYLFVEDPIRNAPALRTPRYRSAILGVALTAVGFGAAVVVAAPPDLDAGVVAPAEQGGATEIPIAEVVPSDLRPSLLEAGDDQPRIYDDGCHAGFFQVVVTAACVYGDPASDHTVVLFGDSHAAHWFPAVEAVARERGWRLLSLTKSACPSADTSVWIVELNRDYHECDEWREQALARITDERPALVIIANSRGHTRDDTGVSPQEWAEGLARTIAGLPAGTESVVLGDTPRSPVSVPVCLSANLDDARACTLDRAEAVDAEHNAAEAAVAAAAGAGFVEPADWLCADGVCRVIARNLLMYRDDQHLTSDFAAWLAPQLSTALPGPESRQVGNG